MDWNNTPICYTFDTITNTYTKPVYPCDGGIWQLPTRNPEYPDLTASFCNRLLWLISREIRHYEGVREAAIRETELRKLKALESYYTQRADKHYTTNRDKAYRSRKCARWIDGYRTNSNEY